MDGHDVNDRARWGAGTAESRHDGARPTSSSTAGTPVFEPADAVSAAGCNLFFLRGNIMCVHARDILLPTRVLDSRRLRWTDGRRCLVGLGNVSPDGLAAKRLSRT